MYYWPTTGWPRVTISLFEGTWFGSWPSQFGGAWCWTVEERTTVVGSVRWRLSKQTIVELFNESNKTKTNSPTSDGRSSSGKRMRSEMASPITASKKIRKGIVMTEDRLRILPAGCCPVVSNVEFKIEPVSWTFAVSENRNLNLANYEVIVSFLPTAAGNTRTGDDVVSRRARRRGGATKENLFHEVEKWWRYTPLVAPGNIPRQTISSSEDEGDGERDRFWVFDAIIRK